MSDQNIPEDSTPLSPFEYWQESLAAWTDFGRRTTEIMMTGVSQTGDTKEAAPSAERAETLTSEFLRTLSDLNLRHWQNTARLLDSFPAWMRTPHVTSGAALTDWFDTLQRAKTPFEAFQSNAPASDEPAGPQRPAAMPAPDGKADDLTRIKGIGPKLSGLLNELGIFHFKQIASWSEPEAEWIDDYLSFKGRVSREDWISQARGFSSNGSTVH